MKRKALFWVMASFLFYTAAASADYTLVLKNGRRITAKSYREEGSMIKLYGLGGELGIPKDQVQTILREGQTERQGLNISELEASTRQTPAAQEPSPVRSGDSAETGGSEEAKDRVSAAEAKEYQRRLAEITADLEEARQRYFSATQGGGTSSSATKAGYKALTADLMSRLKDRRGAPPSEYETQEKELSDLRTQIDKLQKERNALVEEMKSKNIPTGLF
jgi:hypothetical protein